MYISNQNPLNININPPGLQSGMPGEIIKIHVVVTNNGDIDAVINLFLNLDEELQTLIGTSNSERQSISLSPNESSNEITFEIPIPVNASPGTYDYTLVIDSPEHYPQHTPINCPSQIKILFKEQTRVGLNDPTFFIKPSTNPHKPLIFKSGEPLQLEIQVINNSDRVDRFRLNCPDLDENWFTINYPKTGLESTGLTEVNALELNNKSQATILLQLHPPQDALEGNYNPAIRLHSENYPDLVLLDLVYTRIPPNYHLDLDLETVLGQVSNRPGEYILSIINQGNLIRELIFNAKTRDEYEICKYNFNPTQVKLLPLAETEVNLRVKPRGWWRRPWLGGGRTINFQVELEDKQNYQLPDTKNQAILIWKSRPIWQFLLLLLLVLGLFGGVAFIVWSLLNQEPLKIETFAANDLIVKENSQVDLSWKISRLNQIKDLKLSIQKVGSNPSIEELCKDNCRQVLLQEKTKFRCQINKQDLLSCDDYRTNIKAEGEYNLTLSASRKSGLFSRRNQQPEPKTLKVKVELKDIAEVFDFQVVNSKITKGQKILFNWNIKNSTLLEKVEILRKTENGSTKNIKSFSGDEIINTCGEIEGNKPLECKNIPVIESEVGTFTYIITAYSKDINNRDSKKDSENSVEVLPQLFGIKTFTINGNRGPNIEVEEGENLNLVWDVRGSKNDIKVHIIGLRSNLPPSGRERFKIFQSTQYKLEVVDKFGRLDSEFREINVKVKPKPQPTPTVTITAQPSIQNNPINNNSNNSQPKTNSRRRTRRRNTAIPFPDIENQINSQETDRSF